MTIDPKPIVAQSLSDERFVTAALANLDAGYAPIPIGRADKRGRFKAPWISGHHGYDHKNAPHDEIERWPALVAERISSGTPGILSLGLVLPSDVIGIDVDAYDGKPGLDTLESWEKLYGPMPPTFTVTARFDGSGIRLYRKPVGWEPQEQSGSGVEFIDYNHRYIAAPPSWHHTGKPYRLLTPEGKRRKSPVLVSPAHLPELPDAYLDGLERSTKAVRAKTASVTEIESFAAEHTASKAASYLVPILRDYSAELTDSPDNTHGPTFNALCRVARESRAGAFPFRPAVRQVRTLAAQHYEARGLAFDRADFTRMVGDAVASANAENLADLKARVFREYGTNTADDDDPFSDPNEPLDPSEFEVREAARRLLTRRAADRLVKEIEAEQLLAQSNVQVFNGVAFLEDIQPGEPVWGTGKVVAWPKNQGFMVFGTDGTGKSTVLQQIALGRLGLRDSNVLGFDVALDERSVLYLALDRPAQIRQSIARMVDLNSSTVYDTLKRRLTVIKGPVPFQCDTNPKAFVDWCLGLAGDDCGLVIVDSVKDMVSSPKEDVAGAGFNDVVQLFIGKGIEFGCAHHNRKESQQNARPRNLADVYGSRWLTAGMGSVLNIWRNDDGSRELTQLKAPYGNPFRPVEYTDDYDSGTSKITDDWRSELASHLSAAGRDGLTDAECVLRVFGQTPKDTGYESSRQKITRQINVWRKEGQTGYQRIDGVRNGSKCKVWRLVAGDGTDNEKSDVANLDAKAKRRKLKADITAIDQQIAELDSATK